MKVLEGERERKKKERKTKKGMESGSEESNGTRRIHVE